jgi:hypothetical protein
MTNKLDVGKALEKLRGSDEPKSRMTILDEKNKALDEEIRRLRAERLRLERGDPEPPKRDCEVTQAADVRYGSLADISAFNRDVCFVPKADIGPALPSCLSRSSRPAARLVCTARRKRNDCTHHRRQSHRD